MSEQYPEWAKAPLLPFQSSDLEKELDVALSHIESVQIPISTLWDPYKCPAVALPYLAWAVKVSVWSESWPELQRRQVVAGSMDLHRIRGTRPAVEDALKSLSVRCEIIEWFEHPDLNMEPGTFRVTAHVSPQGEDGQLDPNFTDEIRAVIASARPASRPFTLSVQGMLRTSYGAIGALRIVKTQRLIMDTQ